MGSQSSAIEALGIAVAARVPVLLWGAPGTGKTSAIRAMADAMGWPCETVIAAIREPSDFAGLPIVSNGGVKFAPPKWARTLNKAQDSILFLDEISTAPPAVQAALLRVVLERVVGDLTLPVGVRVVAAANPPEQAADGWDLSAPLANRFCHLDWSVEAQTFAAGLVGGFTSPRVPRLPEGWETGLATAKGLVAAFVSARPTIASAPPQDAASAGRGWPSPRTWVMTATLWAAASSLETSEEALHGLVMGSVGEGAGIEFLSWTQEMDLPDPEQVLLDPDSFVLPERGDRAYAVLVAVASAVAANSTEQRWYAGWKVLSKAGEDAPDVAAMAARILAQCRPSGAAAPDSLKLFIPLLKEAGLLET